MVNWKEVNWGLILIVVAVVVWDLSRKGSILRTVARQMGSIGLNDVVAGLFA
jgi:hypothetical protein